MVSAVSAIIAFSVWQRTPNWQLLAAAALGTLGMLVFHRTLRQPRRWAAMATVMLLLALNFARAELVTIRASARDWNGWSAAEREARAERVAAKLA